MLEYFKENKNYIFLVLLSLLIIILSFIYYFNENDIEIEHKSNIKYEQKDINNQINNNFVEKKIENPKLEVLEEEKDKKIDKSIILNSTISEKGEYFLKLISNSEIDSQKSAVSYIVVTGNIIDKDSNIDIFSLSLNENYIYNLNNISLEITNNETKEINSCDGNFLNTILPEFSYHIQIDIKEDFAHCYIKSQSEGKKGAKFDNKLINDLDFDKNIKIEERTLLEAKELENLKSVDNKNIVIK